MLSCRPEKSAEKEIPLAVEDSNFLELGVMCGTVQFSDGCNPKIDSLIQFGFALIHHMTFDDAEYNFRKVIKLDPDCFWGHWGRAMTYIHPLWPDAPSKDRMRRGLVLATRALELAKKEKEKLYGNALLAYYENGLEKSEKERLASYEEGWKRASEMLPDDLEARLFYALSRLSTVSPSDKTYEVQKEVGAIAEDVLTVIPDHPGGFHYAIHAYDYPPLAENAIRVANNYSKLAPEIPHALHMPSHIFTRLGYWQKSIDLNLRSANAAWALPVDGKVSLHYFHALDYLVYAYLQKSELAEAEAIVKSIDTLSQVFQDNSATAYALAAMPARLTLEYQDWAAASKLKLDNSDLFSWEKYPHFASLIYFAKGIGAARSGNVDLAAQAYEELDSIYNSLGDSPAIAYWSKQVEIQKMAVKAWETYADGDHSKGLAMLNEAASLESLTEKSPITPGELLPMREMLGDIYLEQKKPKLALENYELSLVRNPNRFNSLFGAGKAAELSNNKEEALKYYTALIELGSENATERKQIVHARNVISQG
jgi:tetratricopeptide (TPR) repeat protein